jgi:phosphate:Na+ symporter
MDTEMVYGLIGGLGLFFFGMKTMSEGLKKVAGDRLKKILHMATAIPIIGILVGAAVTCFIQSSSATTVMVVGFANAGLLSLKQAISVILGANIGTTFTAWLVSSMAVFKVTQYALPVVGIGFAMRQFGKTKNIKFWGEILIGFGILFLGLSFMKDAFAPLKNSQHIKDIFAMFGEHPLLGVLVGIVFTVVLQSSSATITIVQVLAFNGVLSFPAAIPIILGDNIGTTITAQLAAIGSNLPARRAAMAHTVFNCVGVAYMLVFVCSGWLEKAVTFAVPGGITTRNIMFYIAVAHSTFNVVNTLVFLPFIGTLEKISIWLVPKRKDTVELGVQFLEKHLLNTPAIALEQVEKEMVRMLDMASTAVANAVKGFIGNDKKKLRSIPDLEQAVDTLQSEITQYLIELSQRDLLKEESEMLPVFIHDVNDIERVGDHSENIMELAERKIEEKLVFSEDAVKGLELIWNEVSTMLVETKKSLETNDISLAKKIIEGREKKINELQKTLKKGHVDRLNRGVCSFKSGMVFLDLVDNLEKVGDHLTNIAQGVAEGMRWRPNDVEKLQFKKDL